MASIRIDDGTLIDSSTDKWKVSTVTAVAPPTAAFVRIGAKGYFTNTSANLHIDAFQWNYAYSPPIDSLIFKAVQPAAGHSGGTEPVWPTVLGNQVVDFEVTWEAIDSSTVTWEASPILVSGATEPAFPTEVGDTVADNTIVWTAISRRVEDEKCPNGPIVLIAGSKVFCADDDIIAFSATVNPLDWSTTDDAGYLPFGLQAYGSQGSISAMGMYRSNLVAFNKAAFQMWQVDPDPQNMALLDAVPIGCEYNKTLQAFQNDLIFLSPVGVRNMGIAGASTNLQTGTVGLSIDPLVREYVAADEYTPISMFIPANGQYWLVYGPDVLVMTVTGTKQMAWSRYTFPEAITDLTLLGSDLYLRSTSNYVWKLSVDEVDDDVHSETTPAQVSWLASFSNSGSIFAADSKQTTSITIPAGVNRVLAGVAMVSNFNVGSSLPHVITVDGNAVVASTHTIASGELTADYTVFTIALGDSTVAQTVDLVIDPVMVGSVLNVSFQAHAFENASQVDAATWYDSNFSTWDVYLGQFTPVSVLPSASGDLVFTGAIGRDSGSPDIGVTFPVAGYTDRTTSSINGTGYTLNSTYATAVSGVQDIQWEHDLVTGSISNGDEFALIIRGLGSVGDTVGTEFYGTIWWPFLDFNAIGVEKQFVGFDLIADAPNGVSVSVGYDERDRDSRTDDYLMEADSLPGQQVPIPVAGPSFDLRLVFEPSQYWEWQAAVMYVQDMRPGR
jgi:hypothetical protein